MPLAALENEGPGNMLAMFQSAHQNFRKQEEGLRNERRAVHNTMI
jgi:hypothetical protein